MAKINFTEEHARADEIIEKPTWIPVEVISHKEKSASKDNSALYTYRGRALDGEYKGKVFFCQFSEKAMEMMVPFARAAGAIIDKKKGLTGYDTNFPVGKKMLWFVKPGEWEGKMQNQVNQFLPFGAPIPPVK